MHSHTVDQLDQQGSANIAKTMGWIAGIALLALGLVGGSALALNLSEYRAADAQLQLLARQVVQSQENERAHLSRELHDSTSQTLVSIKLLMDSAIGQLGRERAHRANNRATAAEERAAEGEADVPVCKVKACAAAVGSAASTRYFLPSCSTS